MSATIYNTKECPIGIQIKYANKDVDAKIKPVCNRIQFFRPGATTVDHQTHEQLKNSKSFIDAVKKETLIVNDLKKMAVYEKKKHLDEPKSEDKELNLKLERALKVNADLENRVAQLEASLVEQTGGTKENVNPS